MSEMCHHCYRSATKTSNPMVFPQKEQKPANGLKVPHGFLSSLKITIPERIVVFFRNPTDNIHNNPAGVTRDLRCQRGEVFEAFIDRGNIILG